MSTPKEILYKLLIDSTRSDARRAHNQKLFCENIEPAISGHSESQCHVGNYYRESSHHPSSVQSAFWWYELAAAQGHSGAYYQLGNIYRTKRCVVQTLEDTDAQKIKLPNISKAIEYFRKASEQGLADANYQLGNIYLEQAKDVKILEDGQHIKWNISKAVEYFRTASNQGLAAAQYTLAGLYQQGFILTWLDYVPRMEEIVALYQKAATQGHVEALYALGNFFKTQIGIIELNGYEVKLPNKQKAFEYYRQAAKKNNSDAAYELGRIYEIYNFWDEFLMHNNRLVIIPDVQQAISYYVQAAMQGEHIEAQYRLGYIYEHNKLECAGILIKGYTDNQLWTYTIQSAPNIDIAMEWYEKAKEQGSVAAQEALDHLEQQESQDATQVREITQTEHNEALAREQALRTAAEAEIEILRIKVTQSGKVLAEQQVALDQEKALRIAAEAEIERLKAVVQRKEEILFQEAFLQQSPLTFSVPLLLGTSVQEKSPHKNPVLLTGIKQEGSPTKKRRLSFS